MSGRDLTAKKSSNFVEKLYFAELIRYLRVACWGRGGRLLGHTLTDQTESHADRAKRFQSLAVNARLAAAKAEGELHDSYVRLAETWERLAEGAEAVVVSHAAEVTQNPPAHREAAFKLPYEDEPKTEPEPEG